MSTAAKFSLGKFIYCCCFTFSDARFGFKAWHLYRWLCLINLQHSVQTYPNYFGIRLKIWNSINSDISAELIRLNLAIIWRQSNVLAVYSYHKHFARIKNLHVLYFLIIHVACMLCRKKSLDSLLYLYLKETFFLF